MQRDLESRRGSDVLMSGSLLLDAGDDGERRDRAVLQHLHQHRAVAVDVHDVGLRRIAVAHVRDVAHIDHGAVDGLDRQVAEFLRSSSGALLSLMAYSKLPIFCGADRRDQVLRGQRVGDVLAGQAARLQRRGIEVDLDLRATCRR